MSNNSIDPNDPDDDYDHEKWKYDQGQYTDDQPDDLLEYDEEEDNVYSNQIEYKVVDRDAEIQFLDINEVDSNDDTHEETRYINIRIS